jgi:3-oxoacyl-[acyl-carrier protein] reductase
MTPPVALVTGATEGIGRAITFALGRKGYRIAACARTPSRLRQLRDDLAAAGIAVEVHPADVGEPADVDQLAAAVNASGPPEILVNNAGIGLIKPFEELTLDDWDTTMATNLRSLYLVTRAVLPAMRDRKRGAIVNIASLAGKSGFAGGTAYAASKHAMMGFARSLLLEVRQDNIRVITICPGSVDTLLLRHQSVLKPNFDRILHAEDVAATVVAALELDQRATVSELEVRPTNP